MNCRKLVLLVLTCMLLVAEIAPASVAADRATIIRVRLFDAHPPVQSVTIDSAISVYRAGRADREHLALPPGTIFEAQRGRVIASVPEKGSARKQVVASPVLLLAPENGGVVAVHRSDGLKRLYKGRIRLTSIARPVKSGSHGDSSARFELRMVEEAKVFDYVCGVLSTELPFDSPVEALKSVAVLILGRVDFSLSAMRRSKAAASITDSTQEQAYSGCAGVTELVSDAVSRVWSERLTFQDRRVKPFFHSTCAGGTSTGLAIFGDDPAELGYLSSVPCDFCSPSSFYKERVTRLSQSQLQRIFGCTRVRIAKVDSQKRPVQVELLTEKGHKEFLSGYRMWLQLGRALGWAAVPGTRFRLETDSSGLRVFSNGNGHGVGLCDWGAMEQARKGKNHLQILEYYFPRCKVTGNH